MNHKKTQFITLSILLLWIFNHNLAMAQGNNRVFSFIKGERFETDVTTTSEATVRRGEHKFNVKSKTTTRKKYTVHNITDDEVNIAVEIDSLSCNLDVNDSKISYYSSEKSDKGSEILKGIGFILHQPIAVTLDNYGVIQNSEEYKAEMATDTLMSFAGIKQEVFTKSSMLSFLADFTYRKDVITGYSWIVDANTNGESITTRFVVDEINEKSTIIRFVSKITSPLLNTNSSGTYIIDNVTGIIKEKYIYTVAVGYLISAGKTIYAVARVTNTVEKTKKR